MSSIAWSAINSILKEQHHKSSDHRPNSEIETKPANETLDIEEVNWNSELKNKDENQVCNSPRNFGNISMINQQKPADITQLNDFDELLEGIDKQRESDRQKRAKDNLESACFKNSKRNKFKENTRKDNFKKSKNPPNKKVSPQRDSLKVDKRAERASNRYPEHENAKSKKYFDEILPGYEFNSKSGNLRERISLKSPTHKNIEKKNKEEAIKLLNYQIMKNIDKKRNKSNQSHKICQDSLPRKNCESGYIYNKTDLNLEMPSAASPKSNSNGKMNSRALKNEKSNESQRIPNFYFKSTRRYKRKQKSAEGMIETFKELNFTKKSKQLLTKKISIHNRKKPDFSEENKREPVTLLQNSKSKKSKINPQARKSSTVSNNIAGNQITEERIDRRRANCSDSLLNKIVQNQRRKLYNSKANSKESINSKFNVDNKSTKEEGYDLDQSYDNRKSEKLWSREISHSREARKKFYNPEHACQNLNQGSRCKSSINFKAILLNQNLDNKSNAKPRDNPTLRLKIERREDEIQSLKARLEITEEENDVKKY